MRERSTTNHLTAARVAVFLRQRAAWLLVFVVVVPMLGTAAFLHDAVVIFPEGAALALGVLSLRLPDWSQSPIKLAVVPPACAAIGVGLAHAGLSRWAGELAAVTAAFVVLHTLRSRLTPSISAAAFPLVFDVRTWLFPLTVLAICVVLAAITQLRGPDPSPPTHEPTGRLRPQVELAAWTVAAAWIILAGPVLGLEAPAVAPPLFVAMVERFATSDRSAATGLRHWAVTVASAAAGGFAAAYVTPRWVGGVLAVAVILMAFAIASGPHPPALAICLIPQVAVTNGVASYVVAIGIGAAVLYLAAAVINHTQIAHPPGFDRQG